MRGTTSRGRWSEVQWVKGLPLFLSCLLISSLFLFTHSLQKAITMSYITCVCVCVRAMCPRDLLSYQHGLPEHSHILHWSFNWNMQEPLFYLISAYSLANFSIWISEYIYSHCPVLSRTHTLTHMHTQAHTVSNGTKYKPKLCSSPFMCENMHPTCIQRPFTDIQSSALKDHSNDLAWWTV